MTSIACGKDFVIALGLTLSQKEFNRLHKARQPSLKKHKRSATRGRSKQMPTCKKDYDTLNTTSIQTSKKKKFNAPKISPRKQSKSTHKVSSSLNHFNIQRYSDKKKTLPSDENSYTPLRQSPKKERSTSKKQSRSRSRGNSKVLLHEVIDYK